MSYELRTIELLVDATGIDGGGTVDGVNEEKSTRNMLVVRTD